MSVQDWIGLLLMAGFFLLWLVILPRMGFG
jgi:hypothetical protein